VTKSPLPDLNYDRLSDDSRTEVELIVGGSDVGHHPLSLLLLIISLLSLLLLLRFFLFDQTFATLNKFFILTSHRKQEDDRMSFKYNG
jgi:hypothetical protein